MSRGRAFDGASVYTAVLGDDLDLWGHSNGDYSIHLLETSRGDTSFGDARPIADEVASLLGDGEVTSTSRYGNKVMQLWVEITANDHANLAAGEARLMEELDRVNTFTWGGPVGPRSVFEIVRSWSDFLVEDLADVRCVRLFRITLEVLPFARSEDPITFTWTGPTRMLSLAEAGWNQITPSGARLLTNYAYGDSIGLRAGTGTSRLVTIETTAPVLVDGFFLHVVKRYSVGAQPTPRVWIGGELLAPERTWVQNDWIELFTEQSVFDVSAWHGTEQTVRIEFTDPGGTPAVGQGIDRLLWSNYPNPCAQDLREAGGGVIVPLGIDVIPIEGSARTGLLVEFDAGNGLATTNIVLFTAPNPRAALRDQGAAEVGFGIKTVTDPDGEVLTYDGVDTYLAPGRTVGAIWVTSGQPPVLNPDGVWPEYRPGHPTGPFFGYPEDDRAAVSMTGVFDPAEVKVLSPSLDFPSGLTSGGTFEAHEPHHLHPTWSGFAVVTSGGYPVPCTVTYYPRWRHHAGI